MKSIFGSLVILLGFSGNLTAQKVYKNNDSIVITSPDGFFKFKATYGFSDVIEDFDNTQRKIVNQVATGYAVEREKRKQERDEQAVKLKQFLEEKRIEIFTNIIGLTVRETERFWPVYNEYGEKLDAILGKRQNALDKINDFYRKTPIWEKNMLTADYLNSFEQEAALMRDYSKKFKDILGAEKLMLLYRAEYQFKLYLLRLY
jgi:hypothetical protein